MCSGGRGKLPRGRADLGAVGLLPSRCCPGRGAGGSGRGDREPTARKAPLPAAPRAGRPGLAATRRAEATPRGAPASPAPSVRSRAARGAPGSGRVETLRRSGPERGVGGLAPGPETGCR